MAVRGWAQGCVWQPRGSELTADAASGATVLHVEDTTDFDDEAGSLSLNDQTYDYSAGAVDEDAGTVTLDSGITAAATIGDGVYTLSGGQQQRDVILSVSCGDGDAVEVTVDFGQRDLWPEGDYDDPVQVILSDDLERIEDVPGRIPSRDAAFSYSPFAMAVLVPDLTVPDGTGDVWTTITSGWSVFPPELVDRISFDTATGKFTVLVSGMYDIRFGASFASNGTGARSVRFHYWSIFGTDAGLSRAVKIPALGTTVVETNQYRWMEAGSAVSFEVWQNSGGDLDVLGANIFVEPPTTDCAIRWVGP